MSQRGVKRFLEEMQKDPGLRAAFNNAVAQLAQDNGFDVNSHDINNNVKATFEGPAAEPPKTGFSKLQPIVTSQAVGEEDFKGKDPNKAPPSVTLALGEEDKKPNTVKRYIIPREDENGDTGPDVTSMALGEEEPKKKKPGTPKP
jgi:hypothetical protein